MREHQNHRHTSLEALSLLKGLSSLYSLGWDLAVWTFLYSALGLLVVPQTPCCIITLPTAVILTRRFYFPCPGSHLLILPDSAWSSPPQEMSFTLSLSPQSNHASSIRVLPTSRWTANMFAPVDNQPPCPGRLVFLKMEICLLSLHSRCPWEALSKCLLNK